MLKVKIALAAAVVTPALMFAGIASAATFSNVQFDNGDVTISGMGGSTVNATFHVVVPANQVVENIQTDVIGDNLAPVCTSVGGDLGLQEGTHDVTLPVKLPPNTGTYTLSVQGAGIFGGIRSVDCNDNVVGTGSFGSALRTVASSDSSTTVGGTDQASVLATILAWIKAQMNPPAAAPSPKCALVAPYVSAPANTYSSMGVQLQSALLLDNPMSIPALKPGSTVPMGYRGPQTEAALASYNAMYHCN